MVLTLRLSLISVICAWIGLLSFATGCAENHPAQPDAPTTAQPATNQPPKKLMSTDRLINLVKDGNLEANAVAAEMGSAAAPVLARLAADAQPQVRYTALVCLESVGGEPAIQTALAHLEDADEQTASQAFMVLLRYPPSGREKDLLAVFDRGKYAAARLQAPLIIGRLTPKPDLEPWKKRYTAEQDPAVKDNLLVALARMGDAIARDEFARRLTTASGSDTPPWIDHTKYIEGRWVAPHLVTLLDRRDHAVDLAPDFKNRLPQRVCDLAAKALVEITQVKVDFPMQRVNPFTDAELAAIRQAVSTQK